MATIDEIRRANLAALIAECGGNKQFSERLGIAESQLSQWANGAPNSATGKPRGMRTETAQRIEAAGGKPAGWLDTPHAFGALAQTVPTGPAQSPPTLDQALAVLATELARAPAEVREALAVNLAGWAKAGGDEPWRGLVQGLLQPAAGTGNRKAA